MENASFLFGDARNQKRAITGTFIFLIIPRIFAECKTFFMND
jgi:hypothetical protein